MGSVFPRPTTFPTRHALRDLQMETARYNGKLIRLKITQEQVFPLGVTNTFNFGTRLITAPTEDSCNKFIKVIQKFARDIFNFLSRILIRSVNIVFLGNRRNF